MKIALYDQDMMLAARLYKALGSMKGVSIEYYESLNDPSISSSSVVIADPAPDNIKQWLQNFRHRNGNIPLILISAATDLLSGSYGDNCYAISKPYLITEIVDLLRYVALGKVYDPPSRSNRASRQH